MVAKVDVVARAEAAKALVRAGCLDCLVEAYRIYASIDQEGSAARTAVLIALRERELGMLDRGYLDRAEALAEKVPEIRQSIGTLFDVTRTMPARFSAAAGVSDEAQLEMGRIARANRDDWLARLRSRADESELTAYLWVGFNCAYGNPPAAPVDEMLELLPSWRSTPLVRFKAATCGSVDADAIRTLLAGDSRFAEIHYPLALLAISERDLDEADLHLQQAHDWQPNWPAVTLSSANVAMIAEEYDRAFSQYEATLALAPSHPDAMIGRIRALSYLERHGDAIAAINELLRLERWHLGESRYWRAYNEVQLSRLDEAWADIELAAQLLLNAEVPKLAGIIAIRRREVEVARTKFEEARSRNSSDCEVGYYLQAVLAEQGKWSDTAAVATAASECLDRAEVDLKRQLEGLKARKLAADRRARLIARREQLIAAAIRMRAAAWFNGAVANYNLGHRDEARQFADRARDLLRRLP